MKKMQEYVHRFRTGSSSSASETKAFVGSAMSVSLPSSPAATSRTSAEGTRRTGDGSHKGTSSESTSVWYVENPTDMAVKPPELSSLPMMTSSGLQHTVLSALVKSDWAPLTSSPSTSLQSGPNKQESRNKAQPEGTFVYYVTASDTLERIAARYDVTPSELQKLNRLASRMVFAGQILYIPDPNYVPSGPPTPESGSPPCSPVDSRPKLDVPIIKMADKSPEHVPGHVMKVSSMKTPSPVVFTPPRVLSEEEAKQLDEECFERFIKLTAKYISDGMGVVQGTLLVTPNAIMFDPNANDPLVMENGPEQYGVIVVMESIQSAALYHDPAAMTYRKLSNLERASSPKPLVYHGEARSRAHSTSEIRTSASKALNNNTSTSDCFQGITTKNITSGLSHLIEKSEVIPQDTKQHCVSGLSPFFSGPSDSCTDDMSDEGHATSSSSSNVLDRKKLAVSGEGLVCGLDDKTDKEDDEKGPAFLQFTSWEQGGETDTSVLCNYTPVAGDRSVLSEHQPGAVNALYDIATQSSEVLTPLSDAVIRQVGLEVESRSLLVKEKRLSTEGISASSENVISASHPSYDLNEADTNAAPPFVPVDLTTFLQGEEALQRNTSSDIRLSSSPRTEEYSVDAVRRSDFAGIRIQASSTKMSLKSADEQVDFQDFPQNMGTVMGEHGKVSGVFDNVRIKTEDYIAPFSTQNGGDSKAASQTAESVGVSGSENLCQNADAQNTDGSVGEDINVSGVHHTKDEQGTDYDKMPLRTDLANELSYEKGTTEGQEVREERIGNIVYFPIGENQDGKVIACENYVTPMPTSPSFTSQMTSDSEVNIMTKDAVDGSVAASYSESKRRTSGSFSSLRSSAQQISSFVNYATGLFRSSNEDRTSVKDVADSSPNSKENTVLTESENLQRRLNSVVQDKGRPEHSIDVENAVKADERPDLFQPIEQLIPRTAASDAQPPLYLHLHVGQNQQHRNITSSVPWETYRQSRPKPDYWFSVPRTKADNLYAFFVQWRPEIYGDSDDFDPEEQGFVVVQGPEVLESVDENLQVVEEHFGRSKASFKKDWEIVSWKEALRRQSVDSEPSIMPELNDESSILNAKQIYELSESLPPRTIGYKWSLVYSTAKHGFSLNRLYREMAHLDSPILLVVMDTAGYIFGAFISTPLKVTDHFYGTGECCLWAFRNELKMYRWTGQNTFFIKGNFDSISIGASEGKFGLWLDGDLYHGRSHRCSTFDNEVLSSSEDFLLKGLEAWSFGD